MNLIRNLFAACIAAPLLSQPAQACTLALGNSGMMGLSMDGGTLGSEETGGSQAAVVVGSTGSATVQIGAPSLVEWPTGYNATGSDIEIKYLGTGALNGVSQDYTSTATSFSLGVLPLTTLVINARVSNPNSFETGTYRLRTIVTCY